MSSIREGVRSLLTVNLGVKAGEGLLFMADAPPPAGEARTTPGTSGFQDPALVEEMGAHIRSFHPGAAACVYPATGRSGVEPPLPAWEAAFGPGTVARLSEGGLLDRLREKAATPADTVRAEELVRGGAASCPRAVVNIARYSTTHTAFRKLLTACANVRYASMPLFTRPMFFGPLAVDAGRLADSTRALKRALEGADSMRALSPNGTDLTFSVAGRPLKADDGDLTAPGAFGNLPAGEVFAAPVEGTGEGTLVIEWGPERRLSRPLSVRVEKGRAVSVSGDDPGEVRWLEGLFASHPGNSNLAEIGIGTNPGATRPDNILEAEKILGTVHLAFGDNHTFGGRVAAPFHQDFVVFDASLEAVWETGGGRRLLLDRGKPGW